MKTVPLLSLAEPWLILFLLISSLTSLQLSSGLSVIASRGGGGGEEPSSPGSLQSNHTGLVHLNHHHHRVKRQLVAYHRLEAGGVLPVLANRRRGGRNRNAIGEDGTDNGLFKSAGIGYEHKHNDRCEESKCGYNIRHCPHGCVFNSFVCGGGNAYDTCCC